MAVVAEAEELGEGATVHQPVLDGEVTLPLPQAVNTNHAVGEMVGVRRLMEADEELVQIEVSYNRLSSVHKHADIENKRHI